jgi:hypothetical protein
VPAVFDPALETISIPRTVFASVVLSIDRTIVFTTVFADEVGALFITKRLPICVPPADGSIVYSPWIPAIAVVAPEFACELTMFNFARVPDVSVVPPSNVCPPSTLSPIFEVVPPEAFKYRPTLVEVVPA